MDARDETQKLFLSHQLRVNTSTGFLVRIFSVRVGYGRITN
jgi:hypothetical protein